jgi:hypothetical protein
VVDCELEEEWLASGVMDSPEKLSLKLFSECICRSTSSMKDCEKEKRSWMFGGCDGCESGLISESRACGQSLSSSIVGAGLCDKALLCCYKTND